MDDDYILEMRGITKTFPGVKALSDVNFAVRRGEIHAICGENGVKTVPSLLLTPYEVDATNYKELVVDSGYIKEADLQ